MPKRPSRHRIAPTPAVRFHVMKGIRRLGGLVAAAALLTRRLLRRTAEGAPAPAATTSATTPTTTPARIGRAVGATAATTTRPATTITTLATAPSAGAADCPTTERRRRGSRRHAPRPSRCAKPARAGQASHAVVYPQAGLPRQPLVAVGSRDRACATAASCPAIGDHLGADGNSYLYEFDPAPASSPRSEMPSPTSITSQATGASARSTPRWWPAPVARSTSPRTGARAGT